MVGFFCISSSSIDGLAQTEVEILFIKNSWWFTPKRATNGSYFWALNDLVLVKRLDRRAGLANYCFVVPPRNDSFYDTKDCILR